MNREERQQAAKQLEALNAAIKLAGETVDQLTAIYSTGRVSSIRVALLEMDQQQTAMIEQRDELEAALYSAGE